MGINICGRKREKERGSGSWEKADPIQDSGGTASQAEDGEQGQWGRWPCWPRGPREERAGDQQDNDALALACLLLMSVTHQTTLSAANETRSRVQVERASWLPLCPQQGLAQVTGTCSKKETQHSGHTALSSRALTWFVVLTALELPAAPRNHMTSEFCSGSSPHLLGPITVFLPPSPPFLAN